MENSVSRRELIRQRIIEQEERELIQLSGIRLKVLEFLTKTKGFKKEDILVDPEFEIALSDCSIKISTDFLVRLTLTSPPDDINLMIIRCSPTSIESWERYILAFARVAGEYQIPFAVVTDGEKARILDVLNNKLKGETVDEIPSRAELLKFLEGFNKIPFPPERLEREKRIVYAFEGVKCSVVR